MQISKSLQFKQDLENQDFNPLEKQVRNARRIFTENKEDAIAEYIWTNKIKINFSMMKIV